MQVPTLINVVAYTLHITSFHALQLPIEKDDGFVYAKVSSKKLVDMNKLQQMTNESYPDILATRGDHCFAEGEAGKLR